jgi:hypothetical protein
VAAAIGGAIALVALVVLVFSMSPGLAWH